MGRGVTQPPPLGSRCGSKTPWVGEGYLKMKHLIYKNKSCQVYGLYVNPFQILKIGTIYCYSQLVVLFLIN